MELEQIKQLLSEPKVLREKVIKLKPAIDTDMVKTFDVKYHPVTQERFRPKKKINKTYKDDNGVEKTTIDYMDVSRLPVPYQKRIVDTAAAFLCGNPIELMANPQNDIERRLYDTLKQVWEDNKLDYLSKKLCKLMMIDTEVAELWYTEDKKLKVHLLPSYEGAALYPVFDMYNDLVAFGRAYKTTSEDGQHKDHFDIYTAENNYFFETKFGQWSESKPPEPNINKKIPIIYYAQDAVEWADVLPLINRIETLKSNLADTNDYFGSPIIKFKGDVSGVGDKGEQGKAFKLEGDHADANYLTWDNSPESVKYEMEKLHNDILDFSYTPDMTFQQMKNLGGNLTNFGVKMMFTSAHQKAADKEEIFGQSVQRRINYLKSQLCELDQNLKSAVGMSIKPQFTYYLPKNIQEELENLDKAKEIMSEETRVLLNPLLEDGAAEWEKVKKEKEAAEKASRLPKSKEDEGGEAGAGELVAV